MQNAVTKPYVYKLLYIFLALGLAGRCIEKGVEAGFIGLAIIVAGFIAFKNFRSEKAPQLQSKVLESSYNILPIILGLTLISWGISSYFGIQPDYTMKKWGTVLAVVFGGSILYLGVRFSPFEALEKFPRYVMWATATFSLLLILEALEIIPWFTENTRNLKGHPLHTQIRSFSSIAAILIPFAWVEVLKKDRPKYWIIPFIIMLAILVSGGRSGWLALTVTSISFIIIYPWKNLPRPRLHFSLFLSHIIAGAFAGLALYKHIVGNLFYEYRVGLEKTAESGFSGGSGRLDIWKFAIDQIPENPWFGIGVKGFRHLDFSEVEVASTMHPHNSVLELLVETGVIGTILAALFVGLLMFRLIRTIYKNKALENPRFHNIAVGCSCALIAFFVSSLTLTSIFHSWWLTYFVVLYIIIDGSIIAVSRKET